MQNAREIDPSKIVETATGLIRSARTSLKATMQAAEEIKYPLPPAYFLMLRDKLREGIRITRVGFGSDDDFETLRDRIELDDPNYTFHRAGHTGYRRMLLIDDTQLLFAVNNPDGSRAFFFSEDAAVIAEYRSYFERSIGDAVSGAETR